MGLILNASVALTGFGFGLEHEFSDEEECLDFGGFTIGWDSNDKKGAISFVLVSYSLAARGAGSKTGGSCFESMSELELLDAI